jgi:dCMP deaminase
VRPDWNTYFMQLADVAATRATCLRRKVGCVLIDHQNRIIGMGYNGVARGLSHCNEEHPCSGARSPSGTNLEGCEAIHAEQNALMHCQDTLKIKACYTTTLPCLHCVKLLMNTSCETIYYRDSYSTYDEVKRLWEEKAGRVLCHVP